MCARALVANADADEDANAVVADAHAVVIGADADALPLQLPPKVPSDMSKECPTITMSASRPAPRKGPPAVR